MESITVPAKQYFVFLIITLMVAVTNAGVPRSSYEALMRQQSEELGLYNATDKVRILTNVNFKNEVLDRNHSILVEFYNSYCGHCRKFAPAYKQLAEKLYDWRDVLPISAIDCAVEDNNGICREYEIMAYPTLRYFGPAFQPSSENYGKHIMSQDLGVITNSLAQFIAAENKTTNMSSWPDLQPVKTANPSELFEGLDSLKKYVVVVYEPENSTLGVETILHFLRYPQVAVKRIHDLDVAKKYQIDGTRYKIATINRQGSIVPYAPLQEHSDSYKETIISFLNSQHITEKPDTQPQSSTKPPESSLEDQTKLMKIIEEVKRNKHLVYQADLEMAIRNTLHNEIPKSSNINGEKLLALQRFLAVLERYNPLGKSGRSLVSQLAAFVSKHNQELSGEEFEVELKKLERQLGPIYSATHFIGCTGSKTGLRGFSCSLWQLFHFMSVQAANLDKSQDPLEVLQAMHGYIKYFFGCTDCSEHFQAMATRRKIWSTPSKDEAILWLWAAHNEVNQRLAGDPTEDPHFPKIQFPSVSSCPQCYKQPESHSTANLEEKWDKTHVLQFLKNIHNAAYVSRYGLDNDDLLEPTLEKLRQKRMISNVFSDMDMRMGMLLYGFCIVMLVVAFKLFAFKGGYRKKPYSHDMLGKV
ncbi:quiescin sulfhydryl oxidase 1 [Cochliomyia hominivorax]